MMRHGCIDKLIDAIPKNTPEEFGDPGNPFRERLRSQLLHAAELTENTDQTRINLYNIYPVIINALGHQEVDYHVIPDNVRKLTTAETVPSRIYKDPPPLSQKEIYSTLARFESAIDDPETCEKEVIRFVNNVPNIFGIELKRYLFSRIHYKAFPEFLDSSKRMMEDDATDLFPLVAFCFGHDVIDYNEFPKRWWEGDRS